MAENNENEVTTTPIADEKVGMWDKIGDNIKIVKRKLYDNRGKVIGGIAVILTGVAGAFGYKKGYKKGVADTSTDVIDLNDTGATEKLDIDDIEAMRAIVASYDEEADDESESEEDPTEENTEEN